MNIRGRVHNGVVVLQEGPALPEGTEVIVSCDVPLPSPEGAAMRRVELPLVRSGKPGSLQLDGERIAEILDREDAASGR
jgi:hypothetical protein